MHGDNPSGGAGGSSLVGCYIYSVLSGDLEHAAEHDRQLASGEPPVMQAELIVARTVFESLVHGVFARAEDLAVDAFVSRLPATSVIDMDELAAVVRAALVGGPVAYRGMDPDRLLAAWTVASGIIVRDEHLGSAAVGDLVRKGEREAARRGIHLAPAHQG